MTSGGGPLNVEIVTLRSSLLPSTSDTSGPSSRSACILILCDGDENDHQADFEIRDALFDELGSVDLRPSHTGCIILTIRGDFGFKVAVFKMYCAYCIS
jgi:hypothetical protein